MKKKTNRKWLMLSVVLLLLGIVLFGFLAYIKQGTTEFQAILYGIPDTENIFYELFYRGRGSGKRLSSEMNLAGCIGLTAFLLIAAGCVGICKAWRGESLLRISDAEEETICPHCKSWVSKKAERCPKCGRKM